jgi:hypothetical protein
MFQYLFNDHFIFYPTEARRIRMLRDLNYSKKLERRLEFIPDMIAHGERQTEDFLKGLKACD